MLRLGSYQKRSHDLGGLIGDPNSIQLENCQHVICCGHFVIFPVEIVATCGVEGESAEGSGSVCHVTMSCLAKTLTTRSLVCVRFNEAWHGRGAVRELGLSGSVRNMRISSSGVYQPTSLGPKMRRGHSLVTTGRIRFSEFHALGRSLKQDSVAKFPELGDSKSCIRESTNPIPTHQVSSPMREPKPYCAPSADRM